MSLKADQTRADSEPSLPESLGNDTVSHNVCYGAWQYQIQTRPKERVLDALAAPKRAAFEARFWAKVQKTEGCWHWRGSVARLHGQVAVRHEGTFYCLLAHRVAWWLLRGPIRDGAFVLHNCPGGDDPCCVRPEHLFLGTQADNLADARRKGRLDATRPRIGKLTPADRLAIFLAPGSVRNVDLAQRYGVTDGCISVTRRGRFAGSPIHSTQQSPNLILEPVRFVRLEIRGEVG